MIKADSFVPIVPSVKHSSSSIDLRKMIRAYIDQYKELPFFENDTALVRFARRLMAGPIEQYTTFIGYLLETEMEKQLEAVRKDAKKNSGG